MLTPSSVMVAVAFASTTMRSEVVSVAPPAMETLMSAPLLTVRTPSE